MATVTVLIKIRINVDDDDFASPEELAIDKVESELSFVGDVWNDIVSIEYTTPPISPGWVNA